MQILTNNVKIKPLGLKLDQAISEYRHTYNFSSGRMTEVSLAPDKGHDTE